MRGFPSSRYVRRHFVPSQQDCAGCARMLSTIAEVDKVFADGAEAVTLTRADKQSALR